MAATQDTPPPNAGTYTEYTAVQDQSQGAQAPIQSRDAGHWPSPRLQAATSPVAASHGRPFPTGPKAGRVTVYVLSLQSSRQIDHAPTQAQSSVGGHSVTETRMGAKNVVHNSSDTTTPSSSQEYVSGMLLAGVPHCVGQVPSAFTHAYDLKCIACGTPLDSPPIVTAIASAGTPTEAGFSIACRAEAMLAGVASSGDTATL